MTNEEIQNGHELRKEVIVLRDEALKQGNMEWSVKLSHVVKWIHKALKELEPPPPGIVEEKIYKQEGAWDGMWETDE